MKERITYHICRYILWMVFFLPMVSYAKDEVPFNKEGLKQSTGFIENKGQIIDQYYKPNPGVLYLLNTPGLNVQLRESGFSYDLYRIADQIEGNRQQKIGNSSSTVTRYPSPDSTPVIKYHRIDINLLNADPAYTIIPFDPDSDYRNYYTYGLPVTGITNVRSYASILYKNIYPGTDLQFIRDEKNSFKYNFILHPGADPERIRLRINGGAILVDPTGSLRLETELGIIEEKIPECYYEIDGMRFQVSGSFKEVSDSVFGFAFDKAIPTSARIVIDPTPTRVWGTYYGGVNDDWALGCSVDEDLNVFLTGYTSSPNNIATSGAFQTNLEGNYNALLVKFSPSGIRQWGTYYGGNSEEISAQCTIDMAGNIYIAGTASVGSNVATPGCFQFTCGGLTDVFLAKFSTNGYRIWSTFYGGEGFDGGQATNGKETYCIADKNCNIYLSFRAGSDSLATPGTFMDQPYGLPDCILAEFDSSGQRKWATYFGGETADDWPYSCAPDLYGHVYLSGNTQSLNNISTPGSHQEFQAGLSDCFLARFDTLGQLEWSTYYGGTAYEFYGFCSAGANGSVYLCGRTGSYTNISTPGSHQENNGGGYSDAFLVKFDSSGVREWGTYYGGTAMDEAWSLAVDINGNILFTGNTLSTNSIATPGSYQPGLDGESDTFLAKFTPGGQRLWGTYYGGSLEDQGWDVCTDQNTNIYVTGLTKSTNNIASSNGAQNTFGGGQFDGFLVKFEDCPIPSAAGAISGPVNVCIPQTGVVYSVPVINYATGYVWNVPSGSTIVSGAGTNTITVDFGPTAANGKVSVFGTNTCGTGAISFINISVNTGSVVGVTISASADTICAYSPVVFTAIPVNGGTTPSYLWKVNGGGIFPNAPTMTYLPSNGDIVTCILTSSNTLCILNNPATSNAISMIVNPNLPVTVSISPSQNPYCAGTTVAFTATPNNQGTTPFYQWKVNGINAGANSPAYSYIPTNGDVVTCILNSSVPCPTGNPATSNSLTMVENTNVTVSISIAPSQNSVCSGTTVSFLATPLNQGTAPVYQWKVNGVDAGTNSMAFSYVPLNGDLVTCKLTSNAPCAAGNPAISNLVTMIVNPNQPVSILITSTGSTVCTGTMVTYNAFPLNLGTNPFYQWKVNGINAGANSTTYSYVPLNGDQVSCVLTSNATCATGNPATSNVITMTVNPNLPVGVSIIASSNPFCAGSTVTFTAPVINGGAMPSYQWIVNGINIINANNAVFSYAPLNGDVVTCSMLSSEICTTGNPALANPITMVVNTNLPAGITIMASANPFCPGSAVNFTATPVNGGSNPSYQWKVNGINAGTNSSSFSYVPASNDSVRCIINSNLSCVTGNPASSAKIIMIGSLAPNVAFSACFDTVTTVNAKPYKLKGGLPLGGSYSGPGVNSFTGIFTPSVAGIGVKTINYSYINVHDCGVSKSKSIVVQPYPSFTCGNSLVDTRDNKVYPTVQIGSQCWMSKNLDFGLAIANTIHQADNCIAEKYCYNGTVANCSQYGGLYQWDELMKFDDTPAGQGLCPPGWHIPTETDWTTLMSSYLGNGRAGRPLQDTIINGFKALRSGVFYLNSSWSFLDFATILWSSTSSGQSKSISHGMNLYNFSVSLYPASKANAFGVRCLKD